MKVVRDDVGQAAVFRLIPDVLDGIKVWCVRREPLHAKPGRGVRQELSRCGTVGRQTIPNQNDGTTQVSMDLAHELNEVARSRIVIQEFIVQPQSQRPGGSRDGSNCCDSTPFIPRALHGRAAARCPHTPSQRLQQKPTFVDKNQASLTFEALFLVAANIRDASGRSPPRPARGRGAPAFADSSPIDATNAAHTPDETPRRTIAGSCLAPKVRSSRPVRIPSTACRASTPRSIRSAGARTAWAPCLDEVWIAARASAHSAKDKQDGLSCAKGLCLL